MDRSQKNSAFSTAPVNVPLTTIYGSTNVASTVMDEWDVPDDWAPGDIILGIYEVKALLGEGGMGRVYMVRHKGWNVDLAVKTPRQEMVAARSKEFVREAESWVGLGLHPHVVSCYYVRTLGGIPRLFAEYVPGGSLSEWIRNAKLYQGGPQNALIRILDVAIQSAWGLDFAHRQGLVHQDVKPANIMMTPEGTAHVTDFGLARAYVSTAEKSGRDRSIFVSSGGMTPAYCSPEQATGKPLSRKTDLWSWAVSVLEMFSGEVTWLSGQVAAEALELHLEAGSSIREIPPIPNALADLLRACFRLDPEDRPESMEKAADHVVQIYEQTAGMNYPRLMPDDMQEVADHLNNRAVSLLDLGRVDRSEQLWKEALQHEPHHVESSYNRGLLQWRTGVLDGSTLVNQLEEVRKSHESEWRDDYLIGLVLLEIGDYEAALRAFRNIAPVSVDEEVQAVLEYARDRQSHSRRELRTLEGHSGMVHCVSFSEDGRSALSGSDDTTVRVWNVSTGECLRLFEGHNRPVQAVCFHPSGKFAVSAAYDNTLQAWDVQTGKVFLHLDNIGLPHSICLSRDGKIIFSAGGGVGISVWEFPSGRRIRCIEESSTEETFVSSGSDPAIILAATRQGTVRLWNVYTGDCIRSLTADRPVLCADLSEDGGLVVVGMEDGTIQILDTQSARCLHSLRGHANSVTSICFSPNGYYALSGSWDHTMKLWDVTTGRCLHTFRGHISHINSVALSLDGRYALSGSGNPFKQYDAKVRLWSAGCTDRYVAPIMLCRPKSSQELFKHHRTYHRRLKKAQKDITAGAFVSAAVQVRRARSVPGFHRAPEAIEVWKHLYAVLPQVELRGGWQSVSFRAHNGIVHSVCLNSEGVVFSSGEDQTIQATDLRSSKTIQTFDADAGSLSCISINRELLLSGSIDSKLKLWDLNTGKMLHEFTGHTKTVRSVCFSGDGSLALSASEDLTIRLWDVQSGKSRLILKGHSDFVSAIAMSAESQLAVSGSEDKSLKIWDLATGRCLQTMIGHRSRILFVDISPDQRYAVSAAADNTARLWNLATGECVQVLEGHCDYVTHCSFSMDGSLVFTAGFDHTMKIWEVRTGKCVRTMEGTGSKITCACVSDDRAYVVMGTEDGRITLWFLDWELDEDVQM